MIELMVKKGYMIRSFNKNDRRKFSIQLTSKAEKAIK